MPRESDEEKLEKYNKIMDLLEEENATRSIADAVGCSLSTIKKAKQFFNDHPDLRNSLGYILVDNPQFDTDTKSDTDTHYDTDTQKADPRTEYHKSELSSVGDSIDTDTHTDTDTQKVDPRTEYHFRKSKYAAFSDLDPKIQDALTIILFETTSRYKNWKYGNYLKKAELLNKFKRGENIDK